MLQLIEIGRARSNMVVQAFEMWQIPLTNQSNLPRPRRRLIAESGKERAKLRPVRGGGRRRRKRAERAEIPASIGQIRQRIARRRGTDAGQQLQHAERSDGVSWVLDPA